MEDSNGDLISRTDIKQQHASINNGASVTHSNGSHNSQSDQHENDSCHESSMVVNKINDIQATIKGSHYSQLLQLLSHVYHLTNDIENHFMVMKYLNDSEKSFVGYIHCINVAIAELLDQHLTYILDRIDAYDCWQGGAEGNGYRSMLFVTQSCLSKIQTLLQNVKLNMNKLLFRLTKYVTELEDFAHVFTLLVDMLQVMKHLMMLSSDGQLFHDLNQSSDAVLHDVKRLNQECFYGRVFAFQVSKNHFTLLHQTTK